MPDSPKAALGQDSSRQGTENRAPNVDNEPVDDLESDQPSQLSSHRNLEHAPFHPSQNSDVELAPSSEEPTEGRARLPSNKAPAHGGSSQPPSPDAPLGRQTNDELLGGNSPNEVPTPQNQKREPIKSGPRAPRAIGGRRNVQTLPPSDLTGNDKVRPKMTSSPELICHNDAASWQWEMVLTSDEECKLDEVRQNGESLELVGGECRITSFRGDLSVKHSHRESEKFSLFNNDPLVFKLQNNWTGDGRRVRSVTKGYFIVIAPAEWTREGYVPVEPEGCVDGDFNAHYFFRDGSEAPGDLGGFKEHAIVLSKSGFELAGEHLFDDSEHGSLFIGNVPKLVALQGIEWARVGEESQDGWRGENFKPDDRSLADVVNCRQGRFFVRVYDTESKLVDSGEFRFLRDLKQIRVNNEPFNDHMVLVPPYPRTIVDFVGKAGVVTPVLPTDATYADVKATGTVFVDRHPEGDCLRCDLKAGGALIECVVRLPRFWWRLEQGGEDFDEWRDTPLEMSRKEFRKRADGNAVIRLYVPVQIGSVAAGFDEDVDRTYQRMRDETSKEKRYTVELPLSDFVDYEQIEQWLSEDSSFKVRPLPVPATLSASPEQLTLIRVLADPVPDIASFVCKPETIDAGKPAKLCWSTRNTEDVTIAIDAEVGTVESSGNLEVTPATTTTYTLLLTAIGMDTVTKTVTVYVRFPIEPDERPVSRVMQARGGWREGKGFSCGELRGAGLTVEKARRGSISIDKRRRSTHQGNIDTLGRELVDD